MSRTMTFNNWLSFDCHITEVLAHDTMQQYNIRLIAKSTKATDESRKIVH